MASVGSTEQASFLFGLSISRLLIVILAFLISLFFLFCALRPFFEKQTENEYENHFLRSEKKIWLAFLGGLLLAGIGLFLLTRQINAFGNS
jgi:heme O synthase-like polyprenyltransferase